MRRKDYFFMGKRCVLEEIVERRFSFGIRRATRLYFFQRDRRRFIGHPPPLARVFICGNEDYFFMGKRCRLEEIVERRFLFAARSGTRLYFFRLDP